MFKLELHEVSPEVLKPLIQGIEEMSDQLNALKTQVATLTTSVQSNIASQQVVLMALQKIQNQLSSTDDPAELTSVTANLADLGSSLDSATTANKAALPAGG